MKKYTKLLISFTMLFSSLFINAQSDRKTISGKILDKENNEPIPFASIYLEGQNVGTTSNEEGEFVFHFLTSKTDDNITISCIGYESLEKKVTEFMPNQKILLSSNITDLGEVVIASTKKKRLTAKQIVKKAYKNIHKNYPNKPYILEGFIRDLQKEDGEYVEYLECAAKFYHQETSVEIEPKVELVEVRSNYLAKRNPWNEKWERKNSIIDLIEDDFIRFDYGPIQGKSSWKYELEDIVPYKNKYLYKIRAIDNPFQKAILYIDIESFAFVKLELTRAANNGESWKRRLTSGEEQVYYNVIFEYQEYKNKMYLKYQKEEDTWKIYDINNPEKLLFTKNPKKELFVNKVIVDKVEEYPFEKNMDIGLSIENQSEEYNPAFWESYNAPQKTKELSKIEQYLKAVEK